MKKLNVIIGLPAILGLILLITTKIDLYQFHHEMIDVQSMLWREIPIAILGLFLSAGVLLSSVYWLITKQWKIAIQAITSSLLFIICFSISGAMGGAFLNAT